MKLILTWGGAGGDKLGTFQKSGHLGGLVMRLLLRMHTAVLRLPSGSHSCWVRLRCVDEKSPGEGRGMSGPENPTNRTPGMEEEEGQYQDETGLCWTGDCVNSHRETELTHLRVVEDTGKGGSGRKGCHFPGGEERDDRPTDRRLCWGEELLLVEDVLVIS